MQEDTGVQPDRYEIVDITEYMKLQVASSPVNMAFERVITWGGGIYPGVPVIPVFWPDRQ